MANSPVPSSQTFAVQRPELREAGRRVFTDTLAREVSSELTVATIAAAGTSQATAKLIPLKPIVDVTGADGTKGVVLPVAGAGVEIAVFNDANAVLKIYPHVGGDINNGSTNGAISVATNSRAMFNCIDGVTWAASFTNAV